MVEKGSVLARLRTLASVEGVAPRTCVPFAVVSGVHLVARLGEALGLPGASTLGPVTKTLLMPALGLVAAEGLVAARRRTGRWPAWAPAVGAGITFSWFGDIALIDPDWFLAGVGLFGVAQVAHAASFVAAGDTSRTDGRPALALPYALWWGALLAVFTRSEGATPTTAAVAGYGALLGTMAWLSHRVAPSVAVGAASFVLSDSLIGLEGSGFALPAHGFWVMATYLAAQWLIVRGLVEAAGKQSEAAPATGRPSGTGSELRSTP